MKKRGEDTSLYEYIFEHEGLTITTLYLTNTVYLLTPLSTQTQGGI